MLDLHRLRVFRSVVASGSVQAAATNLGYTPSAISQHLSALQRETGLLLLEKAGRGLRPTAAGRALAAEADDLLVRVGATEALVADLRSGRSSSLSIAYFASAGAAWLPSLVRGLSADFPTLRLDLRLSEQPPDDPDERADIHLVVSHPKFSVGAGFAAHHLLDDPYVVVLPSGHPFAEREAIDLAELAAERWVDNDFARGWCRTNLLNACSAAGFRPLFHVEAHDYQSAMAFVAAGIGITVMPQLGALHPPSGVTVVPVTRPRPVRSIFAVIRESAGHTRAGASALELLRQTTFTE